jgi:sodium/hydrogen antiporter
VSDWLVPTIAVLVLAYAAVSRRLAATIVSAAMVFAGAGLLLGSGALDWLELEPGGESVRLLAEATLAIVLFTDAARIDLSALRREVGIPVRLLGIGLPLTIVAGALVAAALLPDLLLAEALVLAVVLAPTDAALGLAVVTDRRLPTRIRQSLNVESGLNDGICVPLLLVAFALADAEEGGLGGGEAVELVVEKIGWGVAVGLVAGAAGAAVLRAAAGRGLVAADWAPLVPTVAALLAFTLAEAIGGSGFIAAFVGGALYGPLLRRAHPEATAFSESLGQLLDAATFVVFGVLASDLLGDVTWRMVAVAALSLTVVRMVPVAVALLGTHARLPTVAFLGWFGPRGLASIVFAVLAFEELERGPAGVIVTTASLTILLSIVAHGVSAGPLTSAYARWFASHPRPKAMEGERVTEPRWRAPLRVPHRSDGPAPPGK